MRMEMMSMSMPEEDQEDEERQGFCVVPAAAAVVRPSSNSRRLSRFFSLCCCCYPLNRNKLPWRDIGVLSAGLLCGILLSHLLFPSVPPSHHHRSLPSPFHFFVVGDWGRRGLYNQSQVAIQMGRIGQRLSPRFVVSTGDNFYPTGLNGTVDPDFSTSFTNVYTDPSLQIPWYAVLGNHDYMGDVLAQFSSDLVRRDSRWFCRRDFDLHYPLCQDNNDIKHCKSSVDLLFFDTNTFVKEYWEPNNTHAFDWRGIAPRQNRLKSQLQDLALKLSKSTAKWKFVIGHHTIRSVGHHGDTLELVNQLLPILERHNVDVYFNGHDHNLQHIKRPDSSVHFFTSGGGSKAFKGLRTYDGTAGVQFVFDGQGFLSVSVTEKSASLYFYDVFGNVLYSYNLEKHGS